MNIVIGLITVVLVISIVSIIKKRHFTKAPAPVTPANPGPPVETAPWIDNVGASDTPADSNGEEVIRPPSI
jgi:hypothetical protein